MRRQRSSFGENVMQWPWELISPSTNLQVPGPFEVRPRHELIAVAAVLAFLGGHVDVLHRRLEQFSRADPRPVQRSRGDPDARDGDETNTDGPAP